MSGWAGFSEDELRRLQQKAVSVVVTDSVIASKRKLRPPNWSRQQFQREKVLQEATQTSATSVSHEFTLEQQLNKLPSRSECGDIAPGGPAAKRNAQPILSEERTQQNCDSIVKMQNPEVKELEIEEIALRGKTRLDQLQQEQKIIEERNKYKRALLAKTIAEKSKQTQAEAVKLKRIQKELQALDDMVSIDISILRGKIEQASWDYTTAKKKYDKAETEYVMAKLDLHKKTDLKEQLTEHLCAVIQQNELRKAHKLEELMQQLQLQGTEEALEKQKEEVNVRNFDLQGHVKEQNGVLEGMVQ
ncbi:RAB6-interacting golgin [Syngnathoides biaculeatus]|uniref:RAB6-interacting golgin n=1 Tax=Syngnathoides biaculeatus TaxID=300417 RepID=UPI002ADE5704|nr:RAB6-interacting golgin [Syngnathoides biaculeatus]